MNWPSWTLSSQFYQGLSSDWATNGCLDSPCPYRYEQYIFFLCVHKLKNQTFCTTYLWALMVCSLQLRSHYFAFSILHQCKSNQIKVLTSNSIPMWSFYIPYGQTLPASALSTFSFCLFSVILHSAKLASCCSSQGVSRK